MINNYLGLKKAQSEAPIIDNLIEHCLIDEQELNIIIQMIESLDNHDHSSIDSLYQKLTLIQENTFKIFENTADIIIESNFNPNTQSNLLRLFQRIDQLSEVLLHLAIEINVFSSLEIQIPQNIYKLLTKTIMQTKSLYNSFQKAISLYQKDKSLVINEIHNVQSIYHKYINDKKTSLKELYTIDSSLLTTGHYLSLKSIFDALERVNISITESSTSIEWLLLIDNK